MKRYRKTLNNGFTLIELLTVIAIIGVLAAILIPVLGSVRNKASSAHSVSNLRQIGGAIMMYASDHNGQLPGPINSGQGPNFPDTTGNTTYINPYLPYFLKDYLSTEPSPVNQTQEYSSVFSYPAWFAESGGAGISYYIKREVEDADGEKYEPMGNRRSASDASRNNSSMTTFQLTNLDLKGLTWIIEVDQQSPIGSPGWKRNLPESPVHGDSRNALLYDLSVASVPLDKF